MSSAMVPYVMAARRGALVSSMYNRRVQRARLAGKFARSAYKNRAMLSFAARRIQRAYRGSRRAKLSRRITGARQSTRQHSTFSYNPGVAQQTLYFRTLTFPDQSLDANGRVGPTIKLSGFKLCDEFTNNNGYPIEMHYAVLQLKDNDGSTAISLSEVKDKFFRETASTTKRAIDFVDASLDNTWKMSMKCNPINPDKFNIITHQRRIMDSMTPNGGAAGSSNPRRSTREAKFYWKNHKWYPLDKKATFNESTSTIPNRPFLVVYWWTTVNRNDFNTTLWSVDDNVTHEHKDKLYFRSTT